MKQWLMKLLGYYPEPAPEDLLACLLDKSVEFGDRDDAAMELGRFDLPWVEEGLMCVVTDHDEDEMIVDSAAESLFEIYLRQERQVDAATVARMHPAARPFFDGSRSAQAPPT